MNRDWMTCAEAAETLGLTSRTVYLMVREGTFKGCEKRTGVWEIPRSEVVRIAKERYENDDKPVVGL